MDAQVAGCQRNLTISAAISAQLGAEVDAAAVSQRSLAISAQLDAERDKQLDAQLDAMSDGSVDAVANPAVDFIPCETAVPGDTSSAAAQQAAPMTASARAGVGEGGMKPPTKTQTTDCPKQH